jgi:hypothetical protein
MSSSTPKPNTFPTMGARAVRTWCSMRLFWRGVVLSAPHKWIGAHVALQEPGKVYSGIQNACESVKSTCDNGLIT